MHARVATFEGGETAQVQDTIEEINRQAASGPPEGVPAVGLLILHQPDQGKVLSIALFNTDDDMRRGDQTLNAMDPPVPGALGRRSSVEFYEVGVKLDT